MGFKNYVWLLTVKFIFNFYTAVAHLFDNPDNTWNIRDIGIHADYNQLSYQGLSE